MRFSLLRVLSAAALLGLAACTDRPDGPLGPAPPRAAISDGAHGGGNANFYFLPPMVANPHPQGTFDGTLSPVVEICEWIDGGCRTPLVASFTMAAGAGSETVRVVPADGHYIVNWHTDRFPIDPGKVYRVRVTVAGTELGFADVSVVGSGRELRNVNTSDYIPLVDGRTLPIKFRIEIGAVFVIGPDGGTANAADGRVKLVVPPGALDAEVGIVIRPAATADLPDDLGLIPGTVFDFQPSGLVFAQPVQLTVAYAEADIPAGVPETALTLLAEEAGVWDEPAGTSVDPASNTISGPIDHFSRKGGARAAVVSVTPSSASLIIGETVQLTAGVTDAAGTPLRRPRRWSSGDAAVATVDGAGLVTATGAGSTTITAKAGRAEALAQVQVQTPVPSHFMYVANYLAQTVSVYATPHNTLVATVPVGTAVTGIAVTPDGRFVYATNQLDNTVSVIETIGHTVIATIPVGWYPLGVATSPDGEFAYVANRYSSSVSVIATATQAVVRTISMPGIPFWITVTPDGLTAFVGQDDDSYVSAVDLSTGSVVDIAVGSRPRGIAVTPDGAYAYVTNAESNTASVIRTATRSVVATVPVGSHPEDVAITPDGLFAYVAADDWGSPNGSLTVIRVADNSVVATIPDLHHADAVAVDPEGKSVYVTDPSGNRIYVVDHASNTVTGTFSASFSLDLVIARVPIP